MQCVFKPAFDGKFYSTLTYLIGYLGCQQNLITEIQSTCPKVADTWWISMHSTTKWLVQHCMNVTKYLNDKTPLCTPNTLWWIFLHAIHGFAFESKILFISLQGLTTIVSEQWHCMSGLIKIYCQMTGMLGPLTSEQIVPRSAKTPAAVSSSFFLSYDAVHLYLENLGVWVLQSVDSLTIEDLDPLLNSAGQFLVDAAEGISKVINVDDNNSNNGLSSN
jgi:hypothetical protein